MARTKKVTIDSFETDELLREVTERYECLLADRDQAVSAYKSHEKALRELEVLVRDFRLNRAHAFVGDCGNNLDEIEEVIQEALYS